MARKKKEDIEKSVEDLVEEQWDLKKIIIGVVTLLIFGAGAYFGLKYAVSGSLSSSVLGTTDDKKEEIKKEKEKIISESKEDLNKVILQIKRDVEKLTSDNLSTSSPHIQKLISDLKELQGKQKEPKDLFCDLVCKKD